MLGAQSGREKCSQKGSVSTQSERASLRVGVGVVFGISSSGLCFSALPCSEHALASNQKRRENQANRKGEEGRPYLVAGQLQRGHGLHVHKEVGLGLGSLALLLVLGVQLLAVDDQAPEEIQEQLQQGRPRTPAQL